MERRLREPALPEMEVVLAGQQSFAEEDLRALEPTAFVELLSVSDEDVADERGVAHERDGLLADVKDGDVSVLASETRQEFEWPRGHGDREAARDG